MDENSAGRRLADDECVPKWVNPSEVLDFPGKANAGANDCLGYDTCDKKVYYGERPIPEAKKDCVQSIDNIIDGNLETMWNKFRCDPTVEVNKILFGMESEFTAVGFRMASPSDGGHNPPLVKLFTCGSTKLDDCDDVQKITREAKEGWQ